MRSSPPIERLVDALKRLPGIGEKSATRLAFHLLAVPDAQAEELADAIARLKREIVLCQICFDLTERSPCVVCRDERRDPTIVCVVEEPADLAAIERTGSFRGRYHVLGGTLSPIEGVGPDDLRLEELVARVGEQGVKEVILATNPNAEGDATAHYIAERLAPLAARLTRIATGMPMGGDFEYADHVTVEQSLRNRKELD